MYSKRRRKYIDSVDKIILRSIPANAEHLLDIGCGNGKRGYEIFRNSYCKNLTMIDNSPEMIKLAYKYKSENIRVTKTNITEFRTKERYDIILSLWNVLGHIPTNKKRLRALHAMKKLLKPQGVIFIDVSNRYNINHYGLLNVIKNIGNDLLKPDIENGDFSYKITINASTILNSTCHFFTPFEMKKIITNTGLKINNLYFIDYKTGRKNFTFFEGQLLYVLSKDN